MSAGANSDIAEYNSAPIVDFEHLRPTGDRIQGEMSSLQDQLKEIEREIVAVKSTLFGLSVIYGEDLLTPPLREQIRRKRGTAVRGLTAACRAALMSVARPCSVSAVCNLIRAIDPLLLVHHRNPRASVMTVLRNFAQRGQVTRGMEEGRSVWQWTSVD
jgi:hypothetical protein